MSHFLSDRYYIFGAGSTAKFIKSFLEKQNKKIVALLTSNGDCNNTYIDKTEVINLSKFSGRIDTSIPVIIAVFNRAKSARLDIITEYLKEFNIDKIINPYDFYNNYSNQLDNWYWLTDRKFYLENADNYLAVRSLFDETKSLNIFNSIYNFLLNFDHKTLPNAEIENQYFPDDIDIWDNQDAFLDVGSFDGQTLVDAYKKYGKMQLALAYEPDPNNINQIKNKIEKLNIANQTLIIPCGVWSSTETLRFSSGGGESSAIQENGDITIQSLSLDETLFEVKIGYIKMDIEGAEFEALIGAQNTIKKYKPTLAISLYHKPDHLFTIPLLINSWNLGYKFYLRSHGNNLFETILYCCL